MNNFIEHGRRNANCEQARPHLSSLSKVYPQRREEQLDINNRNISPACLAPRVDVW